VHILEECSFSVLINFCHTAGHHIPQDDTIHSRCFENLRSHVTGGVCFKKKFIFNNKLGFMHTAVVSIQFHVV
jgi:hypothetical protein